MFSCFLACLRVLFYIEYAMQCMIAMRTAVLLMLTAYPRNVTPKLCNSFISHRIHSIALLHFHFIYYIATLQLQLLRTYILSIFFAFFISKDIIGRHFSWDMDMNMRCVVVCCGLCFLVILHHLRGSVSFFYIISSYISSISVR